MNDGQYTRRRRPNTVGAPGGHVHGTGDFDGDGRDVILWRTDSGALAIWKMIDLQIASTDYLKIGSTQIGVPAPDWAVVQHHFDVI